MRLVSLLKVFECALCVLVVVLLVFPVDLCFKCTSWPFGNLSSCADSVRVCVSWTISERFCNSWSLDLHNLCAPHLITLAPTVACLLLLALQMLRWKFGSVRIGWSVALMLVSVSAVLLLLLAHIGWTGHWNPIQVHWPSLWLWTEMLSFALVAAHGFELWAIYTSYDPYLRLQQHDQHTPLTQLDFDTDW